jgi:restriction endonuclease S subunit
VLKLSKNIEISLDEIEEGIYDRTEYRLDLKFYSPVLKDSYAQLFKGKYPMKFVKDLADSVDSGVTIENNLEYKYLQISDIDGELGEVEDYSELQGIDLPSRAKLTLIKNDIVISSVRPLLREIAIIPEELDGQIGTNGFIQLRCKENEIEPEYLLHILRCRQITDELDRRSSALNYPAISEHDVKYLKIPCPPRDVRLELIKRFSDATAEVKNIKDKVDILQTERSQILPAKLRTGNIKSVPKDVEFSFDEAQSNESRLDVKFYRYSRKHPFEHLPLKQIYPTLVTFSTERINLDSQPDEEFLQVTVSRKKGVVFREKNQGNDIGTKAQTLIRTCDVIVSRIDLYNGCIGIVPEDLDGAIVTRDFMVLKLHKKEIDPIFFREVLKDKEMADYFYAFAVGATGRKRIDQKVFQGLKIPVLPLDQQFKIRDLIQAKDRAIEELQVEARRIYREAEAGFMDALGVPKPKKNPDDISTNPAHSLKKAIFSL